MTSKLSDHLRALPDERLGALIQLRPDLAVPAPADISSLASRVQGRASVARVLDLLDRFALEVLDGLRLARDGADSTTMTALLALTSQAGVATTDVRDAVDRLRSLLIAYGPDEKIHIVPAVDEILPMYPAGLGRPAIALDPDVAALVDDPAKLRRVLLSAPLDSRAVLDRLAAGPPIGQVQPATLRASTNTDSPVRWLIGNRLLVAVASDVVELPREIGVVLRRERGPLGELHPHPPEPTHLPRTGVDSAGAGQALEAVHHVDVLLQAIAATPPTVLRSFGLGVRDLRRLARDAGLTEAVTALLLETSYAAGLLTYTEPGRSGAEQQWLPAPSYDVWRGAPLARRWATLARTWLGMTRAPSMVGQRDEKEKAITALSYEAARLSAPVTRRAVLSVLAAGPAGTGVGVDDVLEQLSWRSPRRMGVAGADIAPQRLARAALAEAAALGVSGLDALTSYGRLLLAEAPRNPDEDPLGVRGPSPGDALVDTVGALMPKPVEHVLVQADLTVVVPGPPEPDLAAELALVADAESGGGATVYRVTPHSVRRALDAGYTAGDVHKLFTGRSRTPLPQTLLYLIDDVARRHGGLRIGTAGSYLRSDDEALLAEVVADRRLAPLRLRRLAPTVLTSAHTTPQLLAELRDAGYAPVAEDASGAAVLARPKPARAPTRRPPIGARPDDFDPPNLTGPLLAGLVEQIRTGDRVARLTRRSPLVREVSTGSAQAHTVALSVLQQALRDQVRVWVGYVDAHGGAASRLVRPVSMGGGYLRAEDDRTEMLHTFALHRITSAVPEEERAGDPR